MDDIKFFEISDYNKYLLLTNTEDIYYYQDEIYKELSRKIGNSFSILIDLFLRNGYSYNRFIELKFDINGKPSSRVVNSRDVSEDVKQNTNKYLINNKSLLENSALSKRVVDFIIANTQSAV